MSNKIILEINIPAATDINHTMAKRAFEKAFNLYFSGLFIKMNKNREELDHFKFMELVDTGYIENIHFEQTGRTTVAIVDKFLDLTGHSSTFKHILVEACAYIMLHGEPSEENVNNFLLTKQISHDNNQLIFSVVHVFRRYYEEHINELSNM